MKNHVFGVLFLLGTAMSGCTSLGHPMNVTLSFRYASLNYDTSKETGFAFEEDPEYSNLVETFSYDYGHLISPSDYETIYATVSDFIPHNEGGYYLLVGFYANMEEPSQAGMFKEGYECLSDATFFYSFEGGDASPIL